MSHSLSAVNVHLVFAVKNRLPLLTKQIRGPLFIFMTGILNKIHCIPIEINGSIDHVHSLFVLGRNHSIARTVEELKKSSSKWIKTLHGDRSDFYWQTGYGIFSVSHSQISMTKRYIRNQEIHHQTMSFVEERNAMLRKHGFDLSDWNID